MCSVCLPATSPPRRHPICCIPDPPGNRSSPPAPPGVTLRYTAPRAYASKRELLAALLRLSAFASGANRDFALAFATQAAGWAGGSGGRLAALFPIVLLYSSQSATLALLGAARPMRLPAHAAVQAMAAAFAARGNADICRAPLLVSPAARRLLARAYELAGLSSLLVPLPLSRVHPTTDTGRCVSVLLAVQLVFGLALPVAATAWRESRAFGKALLAAQRRAGAVARESGGGGGGGGRGAEAQGGPGAGDAAQDEPVGVAALRAEVQHSPSARLYCWLLHLEERKPDGRGPVWWLCAWLGAGLCWQLIVVGVALAGVGNG